MRKIQDYDPEAKPLDGDHFYQVSVSVGQIGACNQEEAIATFIRLLREDGVELRYRVRDMEKNEATDVWYTDGEL